MPLDVLTLPTAAARRNAMVDWIRDEVRRRGSSLDAARLERVLTAMRSIARERFVPAPAEQSAYLPTSLDIGYGQTISDAYIVAVMTSAADLSPDANVLDIGTGSGYQAAVAARLARRVTSIEIVPQLAREAGARLRDLGYANVTVKTGDGFFGSAPDAPFDAILVAAGGRTIPRTLVDQLKPGGRLLIPVGATDAEEEILRVRKSDDGTVSICSLGPAIFVPATGSFRADPPAKAVAPRNYAPCFRTKVT